ncbi:DUF4401 domain-containing protein [Melittangium boletus]|uniref:DUF4401 domain-containing protein n=1 Tax=Melittangium boletus DSM 14713 TaxID=1294270 RepID=A0A250I7P0_9BACT|nr:DUF4401 domain-containing protein [Melittangium boletus]ATB27889.1 hypothetical protein MEBOL_001334 [Melittangium boletus DSM 14713]
MTLAFKPSLREVLPSEQHERARAALESNQELVTSTPWFIRVLIGGGAWLSSLFLMIFVGMALSFAEKEGALILGLLLTGGAIVLRRSEPGLFLTQTALAIGLAGQGLFAFGMDSLVRNVPLALALFVLEVFILVVYPDLIQRFLSTCAASLALLYVLHQGLSIVVMDVGLVGLAALAHGLFLHQGTLQARRWGALVTPAAFGLVTTLLTLLLVGAWQGELFGDEAVLRILVTMGLTTVTLYSAWRVLEELNTAPGGTAGVTLFVALSLTALLTFRAPGVIAAVGVVLLGFHRRSVVLLGMAVVFILAFGVNYYYSLELTLLAKSLALLGGGLVMLGLRLFILRRFPLAPEVS